MAELEIYFKKLEKGVGVILKKCGNMISGTAGSDLRHFDADVNILKKKLPKMLRDKESRKIIATVQLLSERLDNINKDEPLKRNKDVKRLLELLNSQWNRLLTEIIKMIPKMELEPGKVTARLSRFFKTGK